MRTTNNLSMQTIETCKSNREKLARIAKAMGHPTRLAILKFIAEQESCFFGAIEECLPIAKATVSQHLKELKAAGLIRGEITPPKVKYCIDQENWAEAQKLFSDFFTSKGCCDSIDKQYKVL